MKLLPSLFIICLGLFLFTVSAFSRDVNIQPEQIRASLVRVSSSRNWNKRTDISSKRAIQKSRSNDTSLAESSIAKPKDAFLNYQLRSNDFIRMDVFQEEDMKTEVEIAADGSVRLPLIGKINIAKLSLAQAQKTIAEHYKEKAILINPQINIVVLKHADRVIHVLGQVNKPGQVIIPPSKEKMTLTEVIAAVEDVNLRANPSAIKIKYKDSLGKIYVKKVNFKKIRSKPDLDNIFLRDGDVIFVPESIF